MSVLRVEERAIGSRTWYRLMRDDGLIAMGGLRSIDEAEAWAMEAGHTLATPAKRAAAALDPGALAPSAKDPLWETNGTGKWHSLPRPTSRPPHGASAPGRKPSSAGRAREAVSVPSVRVGPASPIKESYACCAATRDEMGRLCIGDCGPDCQRRAARRAS